MDMQVIELTVNHMENPIGIDGKGVLFSWKLTSDRRNVKQKRFDIQVALDPEFKEVIWHHNEWNDQSINICYRGPELASKTHYYARVKSLDFEKNESDWCLADFETGLFQATDWQADWVTTKHQMMNEKDRSLKPFTGKVNFATSKPLKCARLYISALGIYTAEINQIKVGNDYFTPGWTDYNDRVQYQVYDITKQLKVKNEITVTVAEGWFTGYLGWENKKNTYGSFNAFIAQIEIEYKDGSFKIIGSGDKWQEVSNKWLWADIYNGEAQDEKETATISGHLKKLPLSKAILVSQVNESVRKQEEVVPVTLFYDKSGRLILDLGQNMVGWLKCSVQGQAGKVVSLTHGEILDREGNFYRGNIRDAQQKDTYVLTGEKQVLEPNFTFHGFRYVHLENFPEDVKKDDFIGVVLHSDMPVTGHFETSDPLLNQLHHNILWGQKGNFLDVPTDCPQRDERLGWTADAQIFFPTASFHMNTYNFFKKWLQDLRYAQLENGAVPFVVPDILKGVFADNAAKTAAVWGDAATIIPWEMYQHFGDRTLLEDSWSSMKRWVDYIRGQGIEETLWNTGLQLGDWLALDAKEGSFFGSTDETLIASCYFAYSAEIVAKTAKVLGDFQNYKEYRQLHEAIKSKIINVYFVGNRLKSDTQTAHVIVLKFHLYPQAAHRNLVDRLVYLIEKKSGHLDTGFVGSPYICQVLAENGHISLAYKLLFNRDLPSWLYQVEQGATTVWEHWDGIKPDGTFWADDMNSFNHYAYGSIGIWMYETIGGICLRAPGYKQSLLAPKPTIALDFCRTSLETNYGKLSVEWKIQKGYLSFTFTVPSNTDAEIVLPQVADRSSVLSVVLNKWKAEIMGKNTDDWGLNDNQYKLKKNVESVEKISSEANDLHVWVGSGEYEISYQLLR